MKIKKLLALVLTAVLLVSCTACTTEIVFHLGGTPAQGTNTDTAPEQDTNAPVQTEQTTAAPAPQEQTTAAPAPQEQTTAAQQTPSQETTTAAPAPQETTTAAPAPSTGAPSTTAEIVEYYNKAANAIKTDAKSVTRNYEDYQHNEDKLVLPSLLQSAGKSLIGSFLKKNETPETYEGTDAIKAGVYIAGESYVSKLTANDVKDASCKDNGSEYEITIVAKTEKNPTYGQGVSAGFEIIKTDDVMDAAGFIVKSFDTEYYDCTIKCKVDKATGHVTWINFATPIVMNVASSIGIDATVGMTFIKDYTVTY
ncbi:MAG: hypothetical protein IJO68_05345 [Clostridia bacterium]|nr:hypothetical protein [Clostridia bacterium]